MKPPQVADKWEDMSVWAQAQVIAYNQIREHDHNKHEIELLKAQAPRGLF